MTDAAANLKIVIEPKFLDFYLDLNKNVSGAYFLSGAELFSVNAIPVGKKHSHLLIDLANNAVRLPLGRTAQMQHFEGRVEFEQASNDLVGRWMWNRSDEMAKKRTKQKAVTADNVAAPAVEEPVAKKPVEESPVVKENAVAAYNELDNKDDISKSISANIDNSKNKSTHSIHWIPVGISSAVIVIGSAAAVYFNKMAKDEYEKGIPSSKKDYDDRHDKAGKYQTKRALGIGAAALGLVGLGVSFVF